MHLGPFVVMNSPCFVFSGKKVHKKKPAKSEFVFLEANVSGCASSDEDENLRRDEYDASFVDDRSQKVSEDQDRMYLESVR